MAVAAGTCGTPAGAGAGSPRPSIRPAARAVGAEVDLVHLTDLFTRRHPRRIADYRILAFVGGFAYGDHIAAGFVLATRIRAHLQDDLAALLVNGGLVIGICWTTGLGKFDLPARHGEGKWVVESAAVLDRLESRGQLALRYVGPDGHATEAWPANPNGSARGIVGICDPAGRVLGLMPHPDAFLFAWHHPDWRRTDDPAGRIVPAGLELFRRGVDAATGA